jgi:imidazole glycerol-phosphate synthase subunit HisH
MGKGRGADMIVVVDYGMGNLHSVAKALVKAGAEVRVTNRAEEVAGAEALVVPGVGAFGDAMRELGALGLVEPIRKHIKADKPFLGICLGLQLLFEKGYEDGEYEGLGVLKGKVVKFEPDDAALKIPHMGWNQIRKTGATKTLEGLNSGDHFYFVHSYYPEVKEKELVATWTDYGGEFASSVARGRMFACQFHPEKSQALGLMILRNFVSIAGKG